MIRTPSPSTLLLLGAALAAGCAEDGGVGFPSGGDGVSSRSPGATAYDASSAEDAAAGTGEVIRCEAAPGDGAAGIADCLAELAPGGVLALRAGTYAIDAPVSVPRGVQVLGAGPATVLVAGPGLDAPVLVVGSLEESPSGDRVRDVTISDLSIEGSRALQGSDTMPSAPWVSVAGIAVRYAAAVTIHDVSIARAAGAGVQIDADSESIRVEDTVVAESGYDGIAIAASTRVDLTRVTARANDGAGISMDWGVQDATVRFSSIVDNGYAFAGGQGPGVYLAWTRGTTLAGNEIARNDGDGVVLTNQGMADDPSSTCSSDNALHRNRIAANGQFGVWITHATCAGNRSQGNVYDGNAWGPVFETTCGQLAETAAACSGNGCPNACAN